MIHLIRRKINLSKGGVRHRGIQKMASRNLLTQLYRIKGWLLCQAWYNKDKKRGIPGASLVAVAGKRRSNELMDEQSAARRRAMVERHLVGRGIRDGRVLE